MIGSVASEGVGCPKEAFDFKRSMVQAIILSGKSKKEIAIDLGVSESTLSHWISEDTRFSMPGHLIPLFCVVTGNRALIDHVCERCA